MATFTWNTGAGAWNTGTDWTPEGPPGLDDEALITDGEGGAITGSGTAAAIYFGSDIAGTFGADGAHWRFEFGTLYLTGDGAGPHPPYVLDVEDALTASNAVIDTRAGSGAGAPVAVGLVADAGALLIIDQDATLYAGTTSSADQAALVVGDGSVQASRGTIVTAGGVIIGEAGTAALMVGQGGVVDVGLDALGDTYLNIGRGSADGGGGHGGSGSAVVLAGGVLSSADGVFVGGRGVDGTLDIGNGGTVSASAVPQTGQAALIVGGSLVANGTSYGGFGTLEVDQGGTFTDAALTLHPGTYAAVIAPEGAGYLTVNGTGAPLGIAAPGSIVAEYGTVALFDAGMNGLAVGLSAGATGTITVENGGTLLSGSYNSADLAGLAVAREGSAGVTATGRGSVLDSDGAIFIGRAGTGTLDVLDNAVAAMTDAGPDAGVLIGSAGGSGTFYTGGSGSAAVAGGGSLFSAGGMGIGGGGVSGTLAIDDGLVQVADNVFIASTASIAIGTTLVTDAGTTVAVAATTLAAQGTVTVMDGGTLAAGGTLLVGAGAASTGGLQVGGDGALVSAADLGIGTSSLGSGGLGSVSVLAGGTVAVTGSIEVGGEVGGLSGSFRSTGTLMLDGGMVDPLAIRFDAYSLVHGTGTIEGSVINDTDVGVDPGVLEFSGTIGGSGSFSIAGGGTLVLDSAVGSGQEVVFAHAGVFSDRDAQADQAAIGGWQAGDTIDLTGVAAAGATRSYDPDTGVLTIDSDTGTFGLSFLGGGGDTLDDFSLRDDGTGHLDVVSECFAPGTRLRTARGPVAVERLRLGDELAVRPGDGGAWPIIWIGRREVDCARHPRPEKLWPVRVACGAFGEGLPERDVWLSPDHAVLVEDVLVPVKYLIDGRAIVQVPRPAVTYFHVELARHAVIFAEGLPVESYLDTGNRSAFGRARRPADFAARRWEAHGCAPLIVTGPAVARARAMLRRTDRPARV